MNDLITKIQDFGWTALWKVVAAAAIIFIGWWIIKGVIKIMYKFLKRSRLDDGIASFTCSVVKLLLWIILIVTALAELNINVNTMIAALGAAGITAGFALQGSLGNFVSGVQIIFNKPYSVGDYLRVSGKEGTVDRIEIMNTTLTTVDNTEIIIPNSVMTSVVVENVSANDTRRLALSYTISYETDTDKARMILTKVVKSEKNILSDPAPAVVVGEYKDSAVELTARVWCKSSETVSLRDQMQEDVKKAFDAEGINIPFPQVDVHVIAPKEEKNN